MIKVKNNIELISGVDLLFNHKLEINNEKIENMLSSLKNKYDLIIIDTSAECFFNYNKSLIDNSDYCIFISEGNLLEIQKSKRYLEMYINEWKIKKEKIHILFNKHTKESIDYNILKEIFSDFDIIGKINLNEKYNLIINKTPKIDLLNIKLKKEYEKILNNLLIIGKEMKNYGISFRIKQKLGIK